MSNLQEVGDKLYGEGMRDSRVESISAILDLVSDDDLNYVVSEVEQMLIRLKKLRDDRIYKRRWP